MYGHWGLPSSVNVCRLKVFKNKLVGPQAVYGSNLEVMIAVLKGIDQDLFGIHFQN